MMQKIDTFFGEYRFLSNFWTCSIPWNGWMFASTEHAYQASKAKNPQHMSKFIKSTLSAGQAKALGRRVKLREDWEVVKDPIMYELLVIKFTHHPKLAAKLMATWKAELIEGNTWGDRYWGVCKGEGLNKLGNMLMAIREKLLTGELQPYVI